jgi:hypothetical protein
MVLGREGSLVDIRCTSSKSISAQLVSVAVLAAI